MNLYSIVEYKSTVVCTITDSDTLVAKSQVREKTNAYATTIGQLGILFTNTQNDNYNAFAVDDFNNLTITNSAGVVTSAWANVDACLADVNLILQLDITATILGDIIVSSKDVEIIEMCDTHLCSESGVWCNYDGGGLPNTLGLGMNSFLGTAILVKVDWGDGIVQDYDMTSVMTGDSHTYTVTDYGVKTIRIIAYLASLDKYFVVIGQITLTGVGDAVTGEWHDNIDLGQKTTKFLRHFVYNSDGTLDTSYDTLTNGVAYVSGNYVNVGCCSCGEDAFYTIQFFGNGTENLYNFVFLGADFEAPLDTTLYGGEWNFISICVLLGTPIINGVPVSVGYNFNYSDNNVRYARTIGLVTTDVDNILLTAYRIIKL
jgi:hypothetical protein